MLFETEKEAKTFLKFNEGEVNADGSREMRVYYCPACCGYHISSHKYKGDNKKTDRMIEAYNRQNTGVTTNEVIEGNKVFDELVKSGITKKKEIKDFVNAQNISGNAKGVAKKNYYKYLKQKGIWPKNM